MHSQDRSSLMSKFHRWLCMIDRASRPLETVGCWLQEDRLAQETKVCEFRDNHLCRLLRVFRYFPTSNDCLA